MQGAGKISDKVGSFFSRFFLSKSKFGKVEKSQFFSK